MAWILAMPSQQGYSAFLATGFFHWQRAFARWTRCTRYIIRNRPHLSSCRREQAHPDLTYVQVDELCVFVRDVTPEISADEAVPPTQSESASATSHVSGGGGGVSARFTTTVSFESVPAMSSVLEGCASAPFTTFYAVSIITPKSGVPHHAF